MYRLIQTKYRNTFFDKLIWNTKKKYTTNFQSEHFGEMDIFIEKLA